MSALTCALLLAGLGALASARCAADEDGAAPRVSDEGPAAAHGRCVLAVRVTDGKGPLPFRAVVTASDGTHPDGGGRGTYADGRFFGEGAFTVTVPPGRTALNVRSGPNHVPCEGVVDARPDRRIGVTVELRQWFSPEKRGWFSGDNHVHTQHDRDAPIPSDDAFTALQGRAQGLSWITQATKAGGGRVGATLDTPTFLYRHAAEIGMGAYVGHVNTPGIGRPLTAFWAGADGPLPLRRVYQEARGAGGIVTYTHPLVPAHLLHWMGATQAYADAVLGQTADAFDVDGQASEALYFALLNLGARLAVSSSTDSTLERPHTRAPGDRRVYVHSGRLDYAAAVRALGEGRSLATNGGPLFAFLTVDGREPGDLLPAGGATRRVRLEVHSLHTLEAAEVVSGGKVAHRFDVRGRSGALVLECAVEAPRRGWLLARVRDTRGHWAVTGPAWLQDAPRGPLPGSAALLLEVANHARMTALRRGFTAHVLVTVAPGDPLTAVQLLRDGRVVRSLDPARGDRLSAGRVAVTGLGDDYGDGQAWVRDAAGAALHVQADVPVTETGWYAVRAITASGRELVSDEVRFEAAAPKSHAICTAHLLGLGTRLDRWGYGEDMPLADVKTPFEGDHWWYPERTYWRLAGTFDGEVARFSTGNDAEAAPRFRASARLPGPGGKGG